MVVHGDNKPEKISAGSMPNKPGRAWVRLALNARQETFEDGRTGWVYDEYTTEVEDTPGLPDEVTANYDALLREAKANEKSKADLVAENEELSAAVSDNDAMTVAHEYRLTLLELGLSE